MRIDSAVKDMVGSGGCGTRGLAFVPVLDDTGHDEGVGQQVAAEDA